MSLYHRSIHDTMVRAPSYWEETAGSSRGDWPALEGGQTCGVAIIGGGFTGLSAALHLARDHGIDARVLEAGPIAWGASGRNGGFCLIGATKLSIAAMVRQYGLEETQRFYAAQQEAVLICTTVFRIAVRGRPVSGRHVPASTWRVTDRGRPG